MKGGQGFLTVHGLHAAEGAETGSVDAGIMVLLLGLTLVLVAGSLVLFERRDAI